VFTVTITITMTRVCIVHTHRQFTNKMATTATRFYSIKIHQFMNSEAGDTQANVQIMYQ